MLLFVMLALVLVLLFPGILINNTTLPLARPLLSFVSITADWNGGSWGASSESLWKKRIQLKLDGPCARHVEPYIDVCLEKLDLEIVVDVLHKQLFIERLVIPSGQIRTDESNRQQSLTMAQGLEKFRASVARIGWNDIRVSDLGVLSIKENSVMRSLLRVNAASGKTLEAELSGHVTKQGKTYPVEASLKFRTNPKKLTEFHFVSSVGRRPYRSRFETSGIFHNVSLTGKFDLQAAHPWKGVVQLLAKDCAYQANENSQLIINASTECTMSFTPDLQAGGPGQMARHLFVSSDKGSQSIAVKFKANAQLPVGNFKRLTSEIQAVVEPVGVNGVGLDAKVEVNLAAALPVHAKLTMKAPDFPNVVNRLKDTRWAVPAPFNQLDGAMTVGATASTDLSFKKVDTNFSVLSDLASERQEFAFSGKGTILSAAVVRGKRRLLLDADIKFGKTELFLPRLDPFNLPQLLPDPNIVHAKTEESQRTDLQYRLRLTTTRGQPIRLRMTHFRMTVPLQLDLLLRTDQPAQGNIRISRFQSRLFRRDADIREVRVTFPREGAPQLSAKVAVNFVNYDLTLRAFGLLRAPRFSVTSNPPLSENSAISLLLFGRTLEELSPGQGESLGNAKAALANGAISATSMYLLASTPIETIGYDPALRRFSATVRLFDGTSLRVQSAREGWTEVGVRKRLGPNWVLNTHIERLPVDDRKSTSTFIEWSRSY